VYYWKEDNGWFYHHEGRGYWDGKYFTMQPSKKNPPTCSYRTTKRSKACGGRVALMKNGRIYKCASCGAKYEMR
jgi:hypothetical protein